MFNLNELSEKDLLNKIKDIETKKSRDALKDLFKDQIKVSFMFKVLSNIKKITRNFDEIREYYVPSNLKDYSYMFLNGADNIEYDVCSHICGIHNYNMLLVDEHKRGLLQQDPKYILELSNKVIEQIRVRNVGSKWFKNKKIYEYENFMYYPFVYYLHSLTFYLLELLKKKLENDKENNEKEQVLNSFLGAIVEKSRGLLSMIENETFECGFPILRNIIELYLIYLSFSYSKADVKNYLRFNGYKIQYDCLFEMPLEFEKEHFEKAKDINKIAYLNYGWLDDIFEFEYLGIEKSYNISDIVALVDQLIYNDRKIKNYGSDLGIYYKKCHYHSHANIYRMMYPIIDVMDLCLGLSDVLLGVAYEFEKNMKIELFNGIDIVKKVKDNKSELLLVKGNLTEEQLEIYYKNKKKLC